MNTKIFLAATSHVRTAVVPFYEKPHYILESYMDLKAKTETTQNYINWCLSSNDFLLDSGAFTFMNKSKKSNKFTKEMLDVYIDNYIQFIIKYDIEKFFEMDIDCIIGYEAVKEIRSHIEKSTGKKVIPVWHITRGMDEFHDMCQNYKYVSIGGIASKEIKKSEHSILFDLCDIAHSYGCKIHGLGYLPLTVLNDRKCPFDTVDGTSWQGHIRGNYFELIDNKLVKKKGEKHWKELCKDSFDAWTKFSKLEDVYKENLKWRN